MRTVLTAVVLTLCLWASAAWKRRANTRYGTPAARTLAGFVFLFGGGTVIGTLAGCALRLVWCGVA